MSEYIEKAERLTLPVIAMRGTVAFPSITISFEIEDDASIAALNAANDGNSFVILVTTKNVTDNLSSENFSASSLYRVGTVAKIKQSVKTPDGQIRIIAEGFSRASVISFRHLESYIAADTMCKTITVADEDDIKCKAYSRHLLKLLDEVAKYLPNLSKDVILSARSIKNPGLLADFIASNILPKYEDKQIILECFEPMERMSVLNMLLMREAEMLNCENEIHKMTQARINRNQRDYYLREQMRVIEDELGEGAASETDEYYKKITEAKLPKEIEKKLLKENDRMAKTPFGSSEASLIRSYLDVCLELPWNSETHDRNDIAAAKKILDDDHDGLEKVKERILEILAVKQLKPDAKGQIICLVGPPGVGKTSIASSIARAMKRKFVRVSLGGVRDEADIRGHRKTYIGAMPGRIIDAISRVGVRNPLILLDEIDKMTQDAHGDPSSALLEVLDSEQNKAFRDHFLEVPFDLSDCVFIATANTLSTVSRPLLDRMEVIEMNTYTKREKLSIARNHLIAKQLKNNGLSARNVRITDDAIIEIIDYYTAEAGVRNLERLIAEIARKCAKKAVELQTEDSADTSKAPAKKSKRITIDSSNIKDYLGARKNRPEHISDTDEVGEVNGLAYTEVGGDMLKIEATILDGTGKLELTGSLGDVMKESARIAVSYVRSVAAEYGIDPDFYRKKDIHIHVPEGAVPKDGPSAGVTLVTALISSLSGRAVRRDVAMTGEITLRGKVLAIGGLKEKTMAAYSAGVKTVLIPADNVCNLEDIDDMARNNLTFIPCKTLSDVLSVALCEPKCDKKYDTALCASEKSCAEKHSPAGSTTLPTVPGISPAVSNTVNIGKIGKKDNGGHYDA